MTLLLAALLAAAPPPPLTLDEALAEGARKNLDLELSRAQALSAGVDVYGAYAGVLPRLDLSARFGHEYLGEQSIVTAFPTSLDASGRPIFQQQVVSIPATDAPDYALGLTLQLPLYDGGRNWKTITRAEVAQRAADRTLDETTLGVAYEVTRRFYEVLKAQESLRVLEETVARSDEFLRRSEALFEAGRAGRLDVLTARGNLGTDQIAVEQGRVRLALAQADLAVVLGREAGAPLAVVAPAALERPAAPAPAEPPGEAELLAQARRARPLLASQAENVRASELSEDIARGAWFPTVSAQASYNRQGPSLLGGDGIYGVYADPSRQYTATAALVVQWNVFNGRQTVADEQRAALATRRARAQAGQAEQNVSSEIARARANLVAQRNAAALARGNLAAAEQGVAVARDRLEAGVANQLEVRDASLKLTQAKLTLVQTRVDEVVALADLNRAVGGVLAP